MVMLKNHILVLLPDQLLLLQFPCHIPQNRINPLLLAVTVHGQAVLYPDITAAALFQAVHDLTVPVISPDVRLHLRVHPDSVIRMDTGQGIRLIQLPCVLQCHIRHVRKALRDKFRLQRPVLLIMNHHDTAGKML